ncbi:MAG TPA: hypothetical protein VKT22_16655 [Steroidobacteraceae bacterium]|nr:hypothetical protein [Steroidobacteraceae bacterium]
MTFTSVERSGALEGRLRDIGERLLRQSPRVTRCHLTLEAQADDPSDLAVKIHLCMPGAEIHAACTFCGNSASEREEALKAVYLCARRQLLEIDRQRSSALLPRAT